MAGPNDPIATQPVISADSTQQINSAATAISALNGFAEKLTHILAGVSEKFTGVKAAEEDVIHTTGTLDDIMGVATLRILGASKAFESFKPMASQVSSFTDSLASMGDVTQLSTDTLTKMAKALGMTSAAAVIDEVKKFSSAAAAGADGAIALQQGYLSIQAATGSLGKVYEEAGGDMENLNNMLQKQSNLIVDTARATGTSATQVMSYYKALGEAIPGSIDKQVSATTEAGTTMGNLQAVMAMATGTGRSQQDVTESLTKAWEDYGMEGDAALQFTERMSDLSTHLGVNLSYTKDFIMGTADAFRTLSDHGNNAGDVLNEMFNSFRDTGLSAKQSTTMIEDITKSVGNLTVAQKAFLSAQTGGPGGLRGAFQIENMIRKGDIKGILDKEMQSLKKQFGGKIYTQEEAGQSDFAASQFLKQRELLKSGAMGGMVKDDASATRLLEAMKSGMGGTAMKDVTETLKDSITKGGDVQERSYSKLADIANLLEGIKEKAGIDTLGAAQKYLGGTETPGRGVDLETSARKFHDARRTTTIDAATGAAGISNARRQEDKAGEEKMGTARSLADSFTSVLPESFKPIIDKMMGGATGVTKDEEAGGKAAYERAMSQLAKQQKDLQQDISAHKGIGVDSQKTKLAEVTGQQAQLQSFGSKLNSLMTKDVFGAGAATRDNRNAGAVQQAVDTAKKDQARTGALGHEHTGTHAAQDKQQLEFTIKGINVVCDKCGNTMKPDAHTTVTTAGQTT